MPKQRENKGKIDSLSPRGTVKLDTLKNVIAEMGRIYRLTIDQRIEPDMGTKLIYMLKEIRAGIESGLIEDLQGKLTALSAMVEKRNV